MEMIEKRASREHVLIGTIYGMYDRKNTLAVV
jgi:hypothetical protein